jgi:transmembrane sensor
MKIHKTEQNELLDKYNSGICTPEEIAIVENWYNKQSSSLIDELPEPDFDKVSNEVWAGISSKLADANHNKFSSGNGFSIGRLLVAASLFIVFGLGLSYLIFDFINKDSVKVVNHHKIKPGSNKAYLTLSDGRRIALTDSITGTLALQGNVQITKTADGQIVCKVIAGNEMLKGQYNTLEAPKGGQYQITLIDGTKVWLNAASTLKYPAQFDNGERKVELSGEAYFEVTKDKKKPFRIVSADQEIEVLGTHFNVNAYSDEAAIRTTLLEGSVKVFRKSTAEDYKILNPGQQSVLMPDAFSVKKVDTEEAIAWKEGFFVFDNDNLKMIMRKLERWYDVDVNCNDIADNKIKITGMISRNTELAEVLRLLEETDKFKFKTEGRRVTIMQ